MAPGKWYAVRNGRRPGLYNSWPECESQVKGFNSAVYKSFKSMAEAQSWLGVVSQSPSSAIAEAASSTSKASSSRGKKRPLVPEIEDTTGWDIVYTDGACKGNGKPGSVAGVGVWWGPSDPRNIAERCPGDQTNNRAELIAIVRALEETPISKKPLLIRSDSVYSIKCLGEWLPGWVRNNWTSSLGESVKNKEIIRYIATLLNARALKGQKVHFEHVKGHSGEAGNEGADLMANHGAALHQEPERDWVTLEAELRLGGDVQSKLAAADAFRIRSPPPSESPSKIRKIEPSVSMSAHHIPPSKLSSSSTELPGDDLDEYVDGLLDDEELANISF
ncbi:unnamed protein product [Mycena citricolor]|uniref:Ribonuclease H n=1 Tax=Mycena citricolor TaxID=2018698 RepID=A0AAD2GY36_9AGAR|nr:unnamed protein product [Mycena citricolor]